MAKENEMIIAGADCKGCMFLEDNTESTNKITCKAKNKKYYYGQCIPCDDKRLK